jgi:hypothetical protein
MAVLPVRKVNDRSNIRCDADSRFTQTAYRGLGPNATTEIVPGIDLGVFRTPRLTVLRTR